MRRLTALLVLALAPIAAGCDSPTTPDRSVQSLAITVAEEDFAIGGTGVTIILSPGEALQLGARARLGDGTDIDLTGNADWASDNPEFVSVTQDGRVTGVAVGTTVIRASVAGVEGSARFATTAAN